MRGVPIVRYIERTMTNQDKRIEILEDKLRQACLGLHLAIQVLDKLALTLGVEKLSTSDYLRDLYKKVQP